MDPGSMIAVGGQWVRVERSTTGASVNVKGTLKPHFRAGAHNVTVKVFRLYGHTWKFYMAKKATNHDYRGYTQYTVRMQINKAGQYRFRAYTASTAAFYRGFSRNSRILTVR